MLIWGAIWGAVLGMFWRWHDTGFNIICGLVLGSIAGLTLRAAVRKEARAAAELATKAAAAVALKATQSVQISATVQASPEPPEAPQQVVPVATPAAQLESPHAPIATPTLPEPVMARVGEAFAPADPLDVQPQPAAKPNVVTAAFIRTRAWLFGGNTVVRMGVLGLFIGLAFLAKYAVENSLLPPQLRLAAIGAAGIGLFIAGLRLRTNAADKLAYALTLQGAGVAVLYLTVFAAFRLYQFLPAGAAFGALGLICAFSAVIAIAQNAQAMALIGFAGGFAAPILVSTGQGNYVGLFSYYTLLGVAIAAIAWARSWRALNVLGFGAV